MTNYLSPVARPFPISLMGYDIRLSQSLLRAHPDLLSHLNILLQEDNAGEDIQVVEAPDLLLDVKAVEMDDEAGSFHLKLIWLDNPEVNSHIQNGTLGKVIEDFRERYGQSLESDKTVLLLNGTQVSMVGRRGIELEMCWREIQYPCLHRAVESVQDAAEVIHSYMHGLLKAIANPTQRERFEAYCNMLLVIPGMNPERVRLVTTRYPNMRVLWKALRALGPDLEAGRVQLNAALFDGASTSVPSTD
ncbi:hypothetical protein V5O48_019260, partial [Marasmius crinis-equi]